MNALWSITVDDYINVIKICQELGMQPGESMELVFIEYMKMKGQKPCANTELTKDELIREYLSHDKKVCEFSIDDKGQETIKIHKNKDLPLDNGM
jgi:hypothetical protein